MAAKRKKERIVVKKVKPYPIQSALVHDSQRLQGQIIKLTLKGFLIELGNHWVKVGQYYQAQFEIPVMQKSIHVPCRVIKTYDRLILQPVKSSMHTAELHFNSLTEEQSRLINSFLVAIKQFSGVG